MEGRIDNVHYMYMCLPYFSELLSSTMKFRLNDRIEKIKKKRQCSLQKQMKRQAKDNLANLQVIKGLCFICVVNSHL